jgi:hypothetical protein
MEWGWKKYFILYLHLASDNGTEDADPTIKIRLWFHSNLEGSVSAPHNQDRHGHHKCQFLMTINLWVQKEDLCRLTWWRWCLQCVGDWGCCTQSIALSSHHTAWWQGGRSPPPGSLHWGGMTCSESGLHPATESTSFTYFNVPTLFLLPFHSYLIYT